MTRYVSLFLIFSVFSCWITFAQEKSELLNELRTYDPKLYEYYRTHPNSALYRNDLGFTQLVEFEREKYFLREAHGAYLKCNTLSEKSRFFLYEPIVLRIVLTNTGLEAVNIRPQNDLEFYESRTISVDIYDESGELVVSSFSTPPNYGASHFTGSRIPSATLRSGGTLATDVLIFPYRSSRWKFPKTSGSNKYLVLNPGKYTAIVTLQLEVYGRVSTEPMHFRIDNYEHDPTGVSIAQDVAFVSALLDDRGPPLDRVELENFVDENPNSPISQHVVIALMQELNRKLYREYRDLDALVRDVHEILELSEAAIISEHPLADNILTRVGSRLLVHRQYELAKIVLEQAVRADGECSDEASELLSRF